ncbi:hypothetical protein PRZ48_007502 [Zasmidium cellare]|uniref:Uncharacterized protein n=1 Tax=Zasmidium cellare TaxID=395010 RepID=A0ABR0EKE2_ZASCE|nr:hypothetical protein PRZ48_007502 [Zasmidium cellare]
MAGVLSTMVGSLSDKKNLHVVVLGYPTTERPRFSTESLHDQKAKIVVELFKEISDCDVQTPTFGRLAEFKQYLVDTFKSLGDDDVLIIWFGGATKDDDEEWHVKLENGPRNGWVDGRDFIQQCYLSGCNIALFLDANMPTRFKYPCVPRSDGRGNTEIMARGSIVQTAQGRSIEGHSSDFTINMVEGVNDWVQEIKDGKYKDGAAMSIAQIMGSNRKLRYNPTRKFDRQPRARGRKKPTIDRLVIDPEDVRGSGKLCFRMKRVQDGSNATDTVDGDTTEAEIPEDEGYDEGLDEGIEGPVDSLSTGDTAPKRDTDGESLFCTPGPE